MRLTKLSEKQRNFLARAGINPDSLTYAQGCQMIGVMIDRLQRNLATAKQCAFLKSKGFMGDTQELSKAKASELIEAVKANGWRLPAQLNSV
jgi:hypothetical protein